MKKELKFLGMMLTLILSLFIISSCSYDTTSYQVNFNTNGGNPLPSIEVEKGRLISVDLPTPTKEDGSMFLGWYMDEALTTKWQFNSNIVKEDTTLFAKWRLLDNYPSELAMTETAFSSSLQWIQSNVIPNETTFTVLAALGTQSIDGDGNVTYTYGESTELNGSYTVASDQYTIIWTPTIVPQAGVYQITIQTHQANLTIQDVTLDIATFKGDGTKDNPYTISSATDLDAISKGGTTIGNGKYYKQMNDILDATSNLGDNTIFAGTYDGNNKTISVTGNAGIFYQNTGIIKNLSLSGAITTGSIASIGLLTNYNAGMIQNVTTLTRDDSVETTSATVGDITTKDLGSAGGIVGTNQKEGTISNSVNNARVMASIGGGGIAGQNYGVIENSINYGRIGAGNTTETGKSKATPLYSYSGGIAGFNYGSISRSVNTINPNAANSGNVFAQRNDVDAASNGNISLGGLVGYNGNTGIITESLNTAARLHGDSVIGGLVGTNAGIIEYSYSTAVVAGRDFVGGLVGQSLTGSIVRNTYSIGTITTYNTGATGYALADTATNSLYLSSNGTEPTGTNNAVGNPTTTDFTSILGDKFTALGKLVWE